VSHLLQFTASIGMDERRSSSLEDIVALSDDEVLPSSSHSSVCVQASAKQGPGTQPSKKRSFRIIPSSKHDASAVGNDV